MTYKILPLGPITRDYEWTFHPDSLFLSIFCEKVWIFTSLLNERQTLKLTNYYNLGLMFGTMTGPFTHINLFFSRDKMRNLILLLVKSLTYFNFFHVSVSNYKYLPHKSRFIFGMR